MGGRKEKKRMREKEIEERGKGNVGKVKGEKKKGRGNKLTYHT